MTAALRFLARLALCAIFVRSGIQILRNPHPQAQRAAEALPELPEPHLVAQAQAAVQVASSAALVLDIAPRLSAGALAATLIPVTYVGHPFWKVEDPQARNQQITHFLKNLGLFGALLLVAFPERPHAG
ncbi:MAG: DoxX family protein [Candidatus Dormibacteraeota bacterium]|nr:DoxX family protein [Candidatus Dormibacteraeota bacterium]